MTNAQENKTRDIWMRIPNSGISHDFITNISGSSQWPGREIQFIEMSAYLALQAENEKLKQANKKLLRLHLNSVGLLNYEKQGADLFLPLLAEAIDMLRCTYVSMASTVGFIQVHSDNCRKCQLIQKIKEM